MASVQRKAAASDPEGLFQLAKHLMEGSGGVRKDLRAATETFRRAAEQGHAQAQNAYGHALHNGVGIAQDLEGAIVWYRKAADQNLPHEQFNLAVCLHLGKGIAKDMSAAIALYRKAAAGAYAPAQTVQPESAAV